MQESKLIDLHTHTIYSDGSKHPKDLIDLAISKKIKALAITDHDTIDSIERAVNYAQDKDIMLIPGIEFEAHVQKGQMHILGLFIDYKNKQLIEKLNFIKQARDIRNEKFIEEFNKLGFEITLEELKRVSNGKIIGKPHFAKVFLKKGYISLQGVDFLVPVSKRLITDFNKAHMEYIKKRGTII